MIDWQKLNRICYFPASQLSKKDFAKYVTNFGKKTMFDIPITFSAIVDIGNRLCLPKGYKWKIIYFIIADIVSRFPANMQRQISNSFAIAKVSEFVTQKCNSI